MIDLSKFTTEQRNPDTLNLDSMTPLEIVTVMNHEDAKVATAVQSELPKIASLVALVSDAFRNSGRLIYMGAGTSGRLGVLDAVECPPTFGVDSDVVIGLIAGGEGAFIQAVEGAEDSIDAGVNDLKSLELTDRDIVVGLAASGRTPYVLGGLDYAHAIGCKTAAIACNRNSIIGQHADIAIEVVVGPEVLTGSTRLKAGTAQKLVLNMITTAAMVGVGKVYQNLMVDVMQTNDKLVVRGQNIVMAATDADRTTATQTLELAGGSVKLAIVMILHHCDANRGRQLLADHADHISAL